MKYEVKKGTLSFFNKWDKKVGVVFILNDTLSQWINNEVKFLDFNATQEKFSFLKNFNIGGSLVCDKIYHNGQKITYKKVESEK